MFKRAIAVLLLAAVATAAGAEPPRPLLWKVSDADNSLYLLGSFHMLMAEDYPLAASVEAAFEDAESLVFELSPKEMADASLGVRMMTAATRNDGRTLQESLPAPTWAKLQAYADQRGIPVANLQNWEAWFVSLFISVTEMQNLGLKPEQGLDQYFAGRALKSGKPAVGLETGEQQIALFDGMAEQTQIEGLQDTLQETEDMSTRISELHAMWRSGDDAGLYRESALELKQEYPELYRSINTGRNLAWLPRLRAMLDDNAQDDTLVVVGALHLLGEDGVVELLRAKGYTVERL